jgi:hypothetical protein
MIGVACECDSGLPESADEVVQAEKSEPGNGSESPALSGDRSCSAREGEMLAALRERCARIRAFFRTSDFDRDFEEELQSTSRGSPKTTFVEACQPQPRGALH